MRLRQVAMVVSSLQEAEDDLRAVLGVDVCFRPQDELALRGSNLIDRFRLTNAVFALGDTFIELVTPDEADTPLARYLVKSGGDAGYMILVQCSDIEAARTRADRAGVRIAWEARLDDLHGLQLDPRDTGGSFLSLDQPDDPAAWPWAGHEWRTTPPHSESTPELIGAEISTTDPRLVGQRWAGLLDRTVRDEDGLMSIDLDKGSIRFIARPDDGRPDQLSAVDVAAPDPEGVTSRARERGLTVDDQGRVLLAGVAIDPVGP